MDEQKGSVVSREMNRVVQNGGRWCHVDGGELSLVDALMTLFRGEVNGTLYNITAYTVHRSHSHGFVLIDGDLVAAMILEQLALKAQDPLSKMSLVQSSEKFAQQAVGRMTHIGTMTQKELSVPDVPKHG